MKAASLPAFVMLLGLGACSAPGSTSKGNLRPPDTDAGTTPTAVPFTVSDQFQPTGFMGDTPADFGAITMSSDSTKCPSPRVSGAQGVCYGITWAPVMSARASTAWVGVYWQYPADNWGAEVGLPVVAGATKVSFAAVGAVGGEQVQFIVGGIDGKGSDAGLPYADTFKASKLVTLTNAWATYEIPLAGDAYTDVLGGFAWSITASSTSPITFYVDDIQWEP
jgi:hypothetical protein